MDSEGCYFNALSTYLEGLEDPERRKVYNIDENDDRVKEGTRVVLISDPMDEGNSEIFD